MIGTSESKDLSSLPIYSRTPDLDLRLSPHTTKPNEDAMCKLERLG